MEHKVKVAKAKQRAYDNLYDSLDSKERETELLVRQGDRKGVQQARVIKDRDGNVLTGARSVMGRWKEYFEEMMNEGNERERRIEEVTVVDQEVAKISKTEVRKIIRGRLETQLILMIYLWR